MNLISLFRLPMMIGMIAMMMADPANAWQPLRAHPQNPYILEFRDQPAVLRTYGEHYSSVINSNFDFIPYLDILRRDGMNLTRAFLVGFRLAEGDYNQSPLSPAPAAYVQPWKRVAGQGNALDGLPKWDLSTWNEEYFTRLNAFAQACSDRGIAIELTLFCVQYSDPQWRTTPFNPANNRQGVGPANRYDVTRLVDANLVAAQEAVVRRIVREMNRFDNVYYEIVNEPFWNEPGVRDAEEVAYHHRMLAVIRDEESRLPNRHLVAHNFPQHLNTLSADFDVINEHYPAQVPTTAIPGAEALLRDHYHRGRILSLDETDTTSPVQNRFESWMFFLGGGGIYNGLDLPNSVYTEQSESGDTVFGNAARSAIRNIGTYLGNLNLIGLRRNLSWITGGVPSGARLQAMAEAGQQYTAYFYHGRTGLRNFQLSYEQIDYSNHTASLAVTLPAGTWRAIWTRPVDLVELRSEVFTHAGGSRTLAAVIYQEDVALRIQRVVAGPNTAPSAAADSYTINQDTPLSVPAAGVLANDTDAQSNPLAAVLNTGPAHGILNLNANGGFTYTPAAGYTGTDSFTYHANDGALDSGVVTVTLTVRPVVASALANGSFESAYTAWANSGNQNIRSSGANSPPDGTNVVAFNTSDAAPNGVLSQTFTTVAGQTYLLSFHMGVHSFNTSEQRLQVDVAGATTAVTRTVSLQGLGGGSTRWIDDAISFTAAGTSATVTFRDRSPATLSIDLLLDHVRVVSEDTSLPPGSAPLPTPTLSRNPVAVLISTFASQAGTYELQRSTDLVRWTPVDEIVLTGPGSLDFADSPTADPRVFYRIATKP